MLHVPAVLLRQGGMVTANPARTINQSRVQNRLGKAASGCGAALNSFLVFLGDKGRPYATGPYSSRGEKAIVCNQAPSMAQKRTKPPTALPLLWVVVPQAKIGR